MDNWNKKKTVNSVEISILCLLSSRQCQEIWRKSGEKKKQEEENLDTEAKRIQAT